MSMNDKKSKARKFLGYMSSLLNAEFFFFLEESLLDFIQNSLGQFIFTPLTVGVSGFNMLLSAYELKKAKNKNLSKISTFLFDFLLFSLFVVFGVLSIVGGVIGSAALLFASTILVPVISAISMLYNAGMSVFYFVKSCILDTKKARQQYFKKAVSHAVQAVLFAALTTALTLLLVFGIAPKAMAITCIVLTSAAIILGTVSAIKRILSCQKPKLCSPKPKKGTSQTNVITPHPEKPQENQQQLATVHPSPILGSRKSNNYFECVNREKIMKQEGFIEDQDKKEYLLKEISNKIESLDKNFKEKSSDHLNQKLMALRALKDHLCTDGESLIDYKGKKYASRDDFINAIPSFAVFTELRKHRTDLEDLFDCTCKFLDAVEKKKASAPDLNNQLLGGNADLGIIPCLIG